ncbi:MAG: SEC-C domain-containing protein [Myxococcales bacterium]|nr:SEC-C domain-containing protein [Myxococcales bacterium]
MAVEKNRFELSRTIPADVKREVRIACGFGCVICGNAICEYEHFDPVYADAKEHAAHGIALLCSNCHAKKTRNLLSAKTVASARSNPYCIRSGRSSFGLEVGSGEDCYVSVGRTKIVGVQRVLVIDDVDLIAIRPPEVAGGPPRICAKFYDQTGEMVAEIQDNEWFGNSSAFDIETRGPRVTIRSDTRQIDLVLKAEPPSGIVIEKINLNCGGKVVVGSTESGFSFRSACHEIVVPTRDIEVRHAPFGFRLRDDCVEVGSDVAVLVSRDGLPAVPTPGVIGAEGVKLEEVEVIGPFGKPVRAMRMTESATSGVHGVRFSISEGASGAAVANKPMAASQKQGRNERCACGSGRKHKHCCYGR